MTEDEAKIVLKAEIEKIKLSTWNLMREVSRADAGQRAAFGYRCSSAEAVLKVFIDGVNRVEKTIRQFERDYPIKGEH